MNFQHALKYNISEIFFAAHHFLKQYSIIVLVDWITVNIPARFSEIADINSLR